MHRASSKEHAAINRPDTVTKRLTGRLERIVNGYTRDLDCIMSVSCHKQGKSKCRTSSYKVQSFWGLYHTTALLLSPTIIYDLPAIVRIWHISLSNNHLESSLYFPTLSSAPQSSSLSAVMNKPCREKRWTTHAPVVILNPRNERVRCTAPPSLQHVIPVLCSRVWAQRKRNISTVRRILLITQHCIALHCMRWRRVWIWCDVLLLSSSCLLTYLHAGQG